MHQFDHARRFGTCAAALAVTAALSASAHASIAAFWKPEVPSGLWSDPNNWTDGVVPGPTDDAYFTTDVSVDLGGGREVVRFSADAKVTLLNGSLTAQNVFSFRNTGNGGISGSLISGASLLNVNGPLIINGPIDGTNFALASGNVTYRGTVAANGPLTVSNTITLAGADGRMPDVATVALSRGTLVFDNRDAALSGRLPLGISVAEDTAGPGNAIQLIGNATQAVREQLGSITLGDGQTAFVIDATTQDAELAVGPITRGPGALMVVAVDRLGIGRLTSTVVPFQIGGTGGTQTPIVPLAQAANDGTESDARGFITYDTTAASSGGVIGYRPVRDDEFATTFAAAAPTTNVLVGAAATLNSATTVNSLALRSNLDLNGNALSIGAGAIWNDQASPGSIASAYIIRSTGGGGISSPRTLHILSGGVLTVDAPITAPSLAISGTGNVRLTRANELPGGVLLFKGASLSDLAPGALGTGRVIVQNVGLGSASGSIGFAGTQTVPNDFELDSGLVIPSGSVFYTSQSLSVAAGQSVTINGRVSGIAAVSGGGGLLRLNGGGDLSGGIGAFSPFVGSTAAIELNGTWTPALSIGLRLAGTVYGNADASMTVFDLGRLSPGAPGEVGRMRIDGFTSSSFPVNGPPSNTSTFVVDLAGADADQLVFMNQRAPFGSYSNKTLLELSVHAAPIPGMTYLILENELTSVTARPFAGLTEGAMISNGGYQFRLSYTGGDGNDVTLTAVPEPALLGAFMMLLPLATTRRRMAK